MAVQAGWGPGRLVELDERECWELAGSRSVGRIGFQSAAGLTILPVNHQAVDETIRFRVSAYGALAAALDNAQVAFEVDDTDEFLRAGWSVLIRGRAQVAVDGHHWAGPSPWPEGSHSVTVQVEVAQISGRRVLGT